MEARGRGKTPKRRRSGVTPGKFKPLKLIIKLGDNDKETLSLK